MEKKLTDEEIVKALEDEKQFLLEEQERTGNAPDTQLVYIRGEAVFEILDLIHRLQDEIKYKTECYDELCNMNNEIAMEMSEQKAEIERVTEIHDRTLKTVEELNAKNCGLEYARAELQKQVDKLKGFIDFKTANVMCDKCKEQAVKDTANKIFRQVLELYQGLSKVEKETMTFEWKLLDLAVEYGVEVE